MAGAAALWHLRHYTVDMATPRGLPESREIKGLGQSGAIRGPNAFWKAVPLIFEWRDAGPVTSEITEGEARKPRSETSASRWQAGRPNPSLAS